jgi:hypothetical protein
MARVAPCTVVSRPFQGPLHHSHRPSGETLDAPLDGDLETLRVIIQHAAKAQPTDGPAIIATAGMNGYTADPAKSRPERRKNVLLLEFLG